MNFKDYNTQSWKMHATDPDLVMKSFKDNLNLVETNADAVLFGNLVVHVSGEHLGKWNEGLEILRKLKTNDYITDMNSFDRYFAILGLGANPDFAINHFLPSDQVRILAVTSSALASQNDLVRAEKYLKAAYAIAIEDLTKDDPANKSLAITGNNLACALEEKESRTKEDTELMKLAARIGRTFWEICGTWKEVERAEYRLANTFLQAKEYDLALHHAKICLSIIEENNNEPLEAFFGYEVLALIERAMNNSFAYASAKNKMEAVFETLSAEDQKWARVTLERVR